MTYQFDTGNAIVAGDGAAWLFGLKVLLLSVGWTCPRSGNGAAGGAGDNIAAMADLQDANSWMVLRRPDDGAEWCFSKIGSGDTRNWDVLYSAAALFLGGSNVARAVAADEQSLQTPVVRLFMGGNTTWNAVADDAAPYGWALFGWDTVGTTVAGMIIYDPLAVGTYYADDPDPYICATVAQFSAYRIPDGVDAANSDCAKGWTGATWGAIPGSEIADGAGTHPFPGACGGNPYSGGAEDPIAQIPYVRNTSQAGTSGWKGFGTIVRWMGTARAIHSTLSTDTESRIVFGSAAEICLPWPFLGPAADFAAEYVFTFGLGGPTTTYHKRARDANALAPPAAYVYWQTTDPAGAYPNPPPFGGPLVDTVNIDVVTG